MGIVFTVSEVGWAFSVGQCVHVSENLKEAEGVIIDRHRAVTGDELYEIWRQFDDDGRTGFAIGKTMTAVAIGGKACDECLLRMGVMCPLKTLGRQSGR